MPSVYLIDASAYIYRAFHAIKPLHTSKGLATHAVYGFISILRRLLRERQPEYLAVAFDSKGPVFRHALAPDYKANRPAMPEELRVQIPYVHQLTAAYNFLSLAAVGMEADDLIASACRHLVAQGCEVVVVSGDKDLLQLVSPQVSLWDPMGDKVMDTAAVQEKYGLAPAQLLDYFALVGDTSDNISGVPGVGPKTAQKLLQAYQRLEGIYDHIAELKQSKVKENLLHYRETAFRSRTLVQLHEQAEVAQDLAAYQVLPPNTSALHELFTELEFVSLLKTALPAAEGIKTTGFVRLSTPEQLAQVVEEIKASSHLVLDTETSSLDPLQAGLVGISLCVDSDRAWYLPCGHCDAQGHLVPEQLPLEDILRLLGPLLCDEQIAKIGHNLKYDYAVLAAPQNGGLHLAGPLYDTMLAAWLLHPDRRSYKLDELCLELGLKLTSFAEVVAGDKAPDAFCRVDLDAARDYSCEDVYGCLCLFRKQQPNLEAQGLWDLFTRVEGPLIPVLARMEGNGIMVDQDILQQLSQDFGHKLELLEREIHRLAGHPFNIHSPQQLAQVLFEELRLPKGRKTKTGYSTDSIVLEKLAFRHELPALVVRFRNLSKLKSTYVDRLPEHVHPLSQRVHSSFNQCGTATGRLSSSNPNLQNIPIRTEEGRRIRSAFVAPPGAVLLSLDYSQIDLRVLAHYSQDPSLLAAFQQDRDIHGQTAADLFRVALPLVTSEMRRIAKSINFGIVYGMSSFGLSEQLGISRREAQLFIERYFEHYHGVKQFMEAIVAQAHSDAFVTTLLGRRRQLPEIKVSHRSRREFAERMAINTPIQGTAADIIKLAMLQVAQVVPQAKLLLQIHDELVFEVPEEEAETTAAILLPLMERVLPLTVPLRVNMRIGKHLDKGE